RSQATVVGRIGLEQDFAIQQQGEKFESGKTVLPAQLLEPSWCSKHGERRCNLRIANLEQRAGARGFQHHLIAAPADIREPRQDEDVGIAEWRRLRPVIGELGLDDDLRRTVARGAKAVLEQTVPSQSPDQAKNLLVRAAT